MLPGVLVFILGIFTFSNLGIVHAEGEFDQAEFDRLLLLDTIDFYGLNFLQEEGAFEKNKTTEVVYSSEYEDGTNLDINLKVTTDINGEITAVISDANEMKMGLLKKKKPKNGKTKTNPVPYKLNGGKNKDSFINAHAYNKHKYDSSKNSSSKATQYGKNVDVKKLREDTMNNYDNKWSTKDQYGTWTTHYAKQYDSNISVKPTETKNHRVVINQKDGSKSTQYPLSFKN